MDQTPELFDVFPCAFVSLLPNNMLKKGIKKPSSGYKKKVRACLLSDIPLLWFFIICPSWSLWTRLKEVC
jgi:hypothetical protein